MHSSNFTYQLAYIYSCYFSSVMLQCLLLFQARHLRALSVELTSTSVCQVASVCLALITVTEKRTVTITLMKSAVVRITLH